ncbi:MAG: hypothetical protein JWO03_1415 [Bacteroidetes bacterium]|nr:hypothetical protein [Bacteroidota bacterium]
MNDYGSAGAAGGLMAMIMGMMMIILTVLGIISLFFTICFWKIFSKAGQPGWAILVPIYGVLVYLKIIGKPWWWLLVLMFAPAILFMIKVWLGLLALIGLSVYFNLELAKSFGKSTGFAVGLILLNVVFIPLLAFGDAVYVGPAGVPAASATPTV